MVVTCCMALSAIKAIVLLSVSSCRAERIWYSSRSRAMLRLASVLFTFFNLKCCSTSDCHSYTCPATLLADDIHTLP